MALQCVARLYRAVAFSSSSSTPSSSLPLAAPAAAAVPASSWSSCSPSAELCGCGDKKTKMGKRFKGSYGNARPWQKKKIQRIKDKLEAPSVVCLEDAAWCVCPSDVSQCLQQKALDYACGAGADCTPIPQNGACYNPNTVLAHCSYAANCYFQRKGKAARSCDFSATATVSVTDPSYSGCSYPSSASTAGASTTPMSGTRPALPRRGRPPPSPPTPTAASSAGSLRNYDWPKERMLVQILDDSDDMDVQRLIKAEVHKWQQKGVPVVYRHRLIRTGYKAGNLKSAMSCDYVKDYEFVAIFDADFQPSPDFLKKTVPHFKARWSFVNKDVLSL